MFFEVQGFSKKFVGLYANNNINMYVNEKETVGIIGPNGAGKSTLFKIILGIHSPEEGKIIFNDKDITGKRQYERCFMGISCTFQLAESFTNLDILESVMVGAYCRTWNRNKAIKIALETLNYLDIFETQHKNNLEVNGFIRKKVELASALATKPKILLLDELFAGCTSVETEEIVDILKKIKSELGITIIIIEHVLHVIREICDRIIVLNYGEILETGTPEKVLKSPKFIAAYVGEDDGTLKY